MGDVSFFQLIADAAPVGIVYVDAQERYAFFNRYYEVVMGRKVELGKTVREVLNESQYETVKPYIEEAFAGVTVTFETKDNYRDNKIEYMSAALVPDLDSNGKVRGFIGLSKDVTDRRMTEMALKKSQESLLFALESARMGHWDLDIKTDTITCSPTMLDLWGIEEQEISGNRSILQAKVHPDDVDKMKDDIDRAIKSRTIYETEYRIHPRPGEERWVISRGRCTYDSETDQPSRFSGFVIDITEQRIAREVAEKAIKARDNMISISAHELLTPISGTKLHLQNLIRKLERGDDLSRESLVKIASQTDYNLNRLNKLVNDMLDVSRINLGKLTLKREKINLSKLIADAVDRSLPMLESAGCDAEISIEGDIEGSVDSYRVEQVVSNLVSNACRYAFGKPVQISLCKKQESANLTVRDLGIGIKSEDHTRIFERFERASTLDEKAGLGLGLFLVKQIVEAHGGHVHLESEPGAGAKFTIDLPLDM